MAQRKKKPNNKTNTKKGAYKFDAKKRERWLVKYVEARSVMGACNSIGINRTTFYEYINPEHKRYDAKLAQAKQDIDEEEVDVVESRLHKHTETSWGACIYYLGCKGKHRGWVNQHTVKHTGEVGVTLIGLMSMLRGKKSEKENN